MLPHMSDAVPIVNASQTLAIPSQTESPVAAALSSTPRISTSPPALYTEIQSPPFAAMLDASSNTYCAACCTNLELVPLHDWTHSHIIIATVPSWKANCPACTPIKSC